MRPIDIDEGGNIIFYEPTGEIHPHYTLIEPGNPDGPRKVDFANLLANLFVNPSVITQDKATRLASDWSEIFNALNYDSWYTSN